MMQKPWFKTFIWFIATSFFFLAAGIIISVFRPGPSENEAMKFMMGMMNAMDSSMMGLAMSLESNNALKTLVVLSAYLAVPVIMLSTVLGVCIRFSRRRD